MKNIRNNAFGKLYEIASIQQGFFTTKQALRAGFRANTHPYHVQAGNWVREYRSIYRLAQFPSPERPDLMLWFLWSRNRNDIPRGVYSHDTALSLHDLSDVMPAKLHMTVPKSFRRNSKIPRVLTLHYADIPSGDVEPMEGVSATKPLRTITDLFLEGRLSKDRLSQALKQSLKRGLITRAALDNAFLPQDPKKNFQEFVRSVVR